MTNHVIHSRALSLLHVDDDLTFVYTPSDLALFRYVHEAVEAVRAKLEAAAKASDPPTNPFVSRFGRESRVFVKIETLGAGTDVPELERLATVTVEEASSVDRLREQVSALRPESSDARLLQADGERRLMEHGIVLCSALAEFDVAAYNSARAAATAANEQYLAATEKAFTDDHIPGWA